MRLIEPLKTEPQVGQHPLVPFCRAGGSEIRSRFEPSVPLYGELGALGARRDPRRHREPGTPDRSRRRARRAICGTPGAPSHGIWRPCSPSRQRLISVRTIGFVGRANAQIAERGQDSLITAKISLIARFNSLQGAKKFPVSPPPKFPTHRI